MSKRTKKPGTELTVVERAKQALAHLQTEEQLRGLAKATADITTITNADGREQIHAARMRLKNTRCEIQRVCKTARDEATKFSKAVIAEENRLVSLIEPEEGRLERLQEEWDDAREREKQAAIEAEANRVERINERIVEIREVLRVVGHTSTAELILDHTGDIERIVIDESFAEFAEEAERTKSETLTELRERHAAAVAREAEAERVRKDREELERLRTAHAALQAELDRQAAERHRSSAPETPIEWKRDSKITRDLLSLTGQGQCVPLSAIEQWTDEQCQQAEEWAGAAHLNASDNDDVVVPPIPPHVQQWDTPEQRERIARENEVFWSRPPARATVPLRPSDADLLNVLAVHFEVPVWTVAEWVKAIDFARLEGEEEAA